MFSTLLRYSKQLQTLPSTIHFSKFHFSSFKPHLPKSPFQPHHPFFFTKQRPSLNLGFGFQERFKWDGSYGSYDMIKAELNCPRCDKLMNVVFSNMPLSITVGEGGVFQALNFCPNCRTAFYFRPFKIEPLQGSFIEIGRVKRRLEEDKLGGFREEGKGGGKMWEKLRSYGGGEVGVVEEKEMEKEKGVEGEGEGEGEGRFCVKELLTPKEIVKGLDEFVVGQDKVKKVIVDALVASICFSDCLCDHNVYLIPRVSFYSDK